MNLALLLKEKNYSVYLSVKCIIFSVLCILTCFHGHRQRVVCPKWKICKDHFDAVFLYQRVRSRSGSAIQDHSDHDRSNEPMNPLWTRIQRQNGCSILSRDVVSLDLESSISTAYRQSSFICPISSASAIMKKTLPF